MKKLDCLVFFAFLTTFGCETSPMRMSTTTAAPEEDAVLLELPGGEYQLDGANGKFAWVAASGKLMAFDSSTGTIRQLNSPIPGITDATGVLVAYADVPALAVNGEGKVAWVHGGYETLDGTQRICLHVMLEDATIDSACSADVNAVYAASIVYDNASIVYSMAVNADGNPNTFRFDTSTGVISTMAPIVIEPNDFGVIALRIHGSMIGFMAKHQYSTLDLEKGALASTMTDLLLAHAVDFSATRLIIRDSYMGKYRVFLVGKNGENERDVDSGSEHGEVCMRSVALSQDDIFAVWATDTGLRYQRIDVADSLPQFIPAVSEFVLDGTTLYYIGPNEQGNAQLRRRDLAASKER